MKHWPTIVALLIGGFVAAWVIRRYLSGTSLIDELGDLIMEFTTSEQSRLDNLQPDVRNRVVMLIQACNAEGFDCHVGQTLRTPAEEKAVIEAGRSAVKTHSWHELGRAVDLYPIDPDTGKPDLNAKRLDLYIQMHALARSFGFRGLAFQDDGVTKRYITNRAGKKIWDGGHLEWREPYASIAQAVAAEGAVYGIA